MELIEQAKTAKAASYKLMNMSTGAKNQVLYAMADGLVKNIENILKANSQDIKNAREKGRSSAMIDRLILNESRIKAMAEGLKKVAQLQDPVGGADWMVKRPNGLMIERRRVPLGVVGIIYESRPNVTADAIGLCIKSGNCCLLRGGSEAINSNGAITDVMAEAAQEAGLAKGAIQLVRDVSRESVKEMIKLNGLLDVVIPRGGAGLIQTVVQNATVPVIETGVGNCHVYVDAKANLKMAEEIVFNAKTSRPAVCNAEETLLVHESIANEFLPSIAARLKQKNVELRGCEKTAAVLTGIKAAVESDWSEEYLDYILAIKVVSSLDDAIAHINQYGTRHSEAIVTEDYSAAQRFLDEVDAAAVYVNASTRFTDGEEFGFGAEIGISTQKLHARGPMGLDALTTVKYTVYGEGQIR